MKDKKAKEIKVKVFRYDPSNSEDSPTYELYKVPYEPREKMRVLDALIWIRENIDPFLAIRYSCTRNRCGTCAVKVNGVPQLACQASAEDGMVIEPLSRYSLIKDLVVDIGEIQEKYQEYKPWLESQEEKLPAQVQERFGREMYQCIECGICLEACYPSITDEAYDGPMYMGQLARLAQHPLDKIDRVKQSSDMGLWKCSTCKACVDLCPGDIDLLELVRSLRSERVEDGRIPTELIEAFRGAYKRGNPWGYPKSERSEWTEDLAIKPSITESEILYFVGCAPSYDPRAQQIAKALTNLFNNSGIQFGILGNEETCCGNCIKKMGEEGLFEFLRDENTKTINEHKPEKIVTTSPHCYNAFKNEYSDLDDVEVLHYLQLLATLIKNGGLQFIDNFNDEITVTYQDPCYLGRHNGIYDTPRELLKSVPGVMLVEMEKNRENSTCCSGGGGGMWIEIGGGPEAEQRLSELRLREAIKTGADVLVTACPFCLLTFEEAAKGIEKEKSIEVKDLAELVSERIVYPD